MAPRVAIVGAGPVGLMALKVFKEDGLDVTVFESRKWVGGLWKYSTDEALSAAENTRFNNSKFRASISDYPMPDSVDDFPKSSQLYQYFNDYCDHFDLHTHIQLDTRVMELRRVEGHWELFVSTNGETPRVVHFDRVAIATGSFTQPKTPALDGIQSFSGETVHSINFHSPAQYKDKNVLVVGLHASAQDVIASLAGHARKIFASHRSGVTLLPRYTSDGSVYDTMPPLWFFVLTLYLSWIAPALHNWLMDTFLRKMSKTAFPNLPASWELSPAPSMVVSPPLIASALWPHLESGFCEPVSHVERISATTVQLTTGRVLSDIDVIIFCTGYHATVPIDFQPKELHPYERPGSPSRYYQNMFPIHPAAEVRQSLAILGHSALAYPGFIQFEVQAMAISQIFQGKAQLPPHEAMLLWHQNYLAWRERTARKYNAQSTFYSAFVPAKDYALFLDRTAGTGIREHLDPVRRWSSLQAWKFWWNDRKLYNLCLNGFPSPAIFRLFEMGGRKTWKGAAKQIAIDNERVERQKQARLKMLAKGKTA